MNFFLLFSIFFLAVGCVEKVSGQTESNKETIQNPLKIPPFSFDENEVISKNDPLSKQCKAKVLRTFPGSSIDYSVITYSNNWDFVWRADMTASNDRKGRVVCWSPSEANMGGVILNSKFLDEQDLPLR